MIIHTFVKNGKVEDGKRKILNDLILFFENKKIRIEIKEDKNEDSRSSEQNKFYWGVVVKIASDYTGYTENEMHDCFKFLFLKEEKENGLCRIKSTTELSVLEFLDYLKKCELWCNENGILLPIRD